MILGHAQLLIQLVSSVISLGIKRPRRQVGHSRSSDVEVMNGDATPSVPNRSSWHDAYLNRGQLYLCICGVYVLLMNLAMYSYFVRSVN
jgi:hypothetical protein